MIFIGHLKVIVVLPNNITLKEVIAVKVAVDTVRMAITKKLIHNKRKLDILFMTYRIKVANTHHRIDIRYP